MTPRQRVLTTLSRQPTDRPAFGSPTSVIVSELMDVAGAAFPQAHQDAGLMAKLAETAHTQLRHDIIMPYFSVQHEAAALGCKVDWGRRDLMPDSREHPFKTADDVALPAGWLEHPACRVIVDAIAMLRRKHPDVAIMGKVFGPWTLAYHMFGTENFLMMTLDDPSAVREILARLKEVTVAFAERQIAAGADALTLADHATGDLCSPKAYAEFLAPIHKELARRIPCPAVLHICGNTADRLDAICGTGVAAFHIDTKVPAAEARRIVNGRLAIAGGVNNPKTLCFGNEADLRREVEAALAAKFEIIGPECAVPLNAPLAQMHAMTKVFFELTGAPS